MKNPDKCVRTTSHIEVAIGLYIIGYVILYLMYNFFTFLIDNFKNEAEPWKMHLAQTIVGLVVFKVYYELWRWGYNATYEDGCKSFFGHVVMTLITCGLFLIYRYF